MSAGTDMLNAAALLAQERAAHEVTRRELEHVKRELAAKTPLLRSAESAYAALEEEVTITLDGVDVPQLDTSYKRLAWLRDQRFPAYEQLRQMDTLLRPYRTEGAPTYLPSLLAWVLDNLQRGQGGAA